MILLQILYGFSTTFMRIEAAPDIDGEIVPKTSVNVCRELMWSSAGWLIWIKN
jgi:hypothetical protein